MSGFDGRKMMLTRENQRSSNQDVTADRLDPGITPFDPATVRRLEERYRQAEENWEDIPVTDAETAADTFPFIDNQLEGRKLLERYSYATAQPGYEHLPFDVAAAITQWTLGDDAEQLSFLHVNQQLEEDNIPAPVQEWRNYLSQVLETVPAYQGTTWRIAAEEHSGFPAIENSGDIVAADRFIAASKQEGGDNTFATGEHTVYEIESRTGRDISPVSKYADEEEVLYQPDTFFHVEHIHEPGGEDRARHVVMRELPTP